MIQVFIWATAIYYILGFLEGVMSFHIIKIIGYGILAFVGTSLINTGFHDSHIYIVVSFLFFLAYSLYDFIMNRELSIIPIILTLMAIGCF